jgi:hypothetical protein
MEKEKYIMSLSVDNGKDDTYYLTSYRKTINKSNSKNDVFNSVSFLDNSIKEKSKSNDDFFSFANKWWEKSNLQENIDNQSIFTILSDKQSIIDKQSIKIKHLEKKVDDLTYNLMKKNEILLYIEKIILEFKKENEILKTDPEILKKRISVDPYNEENWNE